MQSTFPVSRLSLWMGIICLFAFFSCDSLDLAFVNKVKRFEPQWMTLSEKVSFIDRNLKISQRRYKSDFETIGQRASLRQISSQIVSNLKSDFRKIMVERNEIQTDFDALKKEFTKEVYAFNEWENLILKNEIDMEKAENQLIAFTTRYDELDTKVDQLKNTLVDNLTSHNLILKKLSSELNIYTNFDIVPK